MLSGYPCCGSWFSGQRQAKMFGWSLVFGTEPFCVVADRRSRHTKAMCYLVLVQASIEKLGNGGSKLVHEHMFAYDAVGLDARMAILSRLHSGMV